ncbi:hypothetical protein [Azotobacter beijerinckii]|uniref:Putative DNA primase/helicase n=1 Tax=Azotobacter beijerinckii TaxID=170623 RepID=A0A1I4F3C5_9GAMM|nr:hypothetical protein [Azotobacter beijerinckii]SFL11317.1 putative DNA primase/helicase [Azotobacter beijerinckii]
MANPAIQFHEVLQDAFGLLEWLPEADGKIHRFHVHGDKPGPLNGWYILRVDRTASGCFGSWKVGGSWHSSPVDPQEAELLGEVGADE